jgi:hypothetical protein
MSLAPFPACSDLVGLAMSRLFLLSLFLPTGLVGRAN